MSCQIKQFANISDLVAVRRYLFPWDDDRGSENWLYNCLVSVSPTGELIAFTNKNRIVVLSAKWDSNAVLNQYYISYSDTLDTEPITAVLCLPIASQSQNSQVGPDWTCIVVGLQNGEVKFYTDDCTLLLMEQFHDERVNNLKCQSHHVSHMDAGSDVCPEELYIQYSKCICVLSGAQLFSTLRNVRSQLARVQAKGDSLNPTSHMLLHKKWGLYEQFEINDVSVVGLDNSNTFNHLLTASICGGFDTKYRAMAPNNTLIVGAGTKPYVGFHYAIEGGMQPLLSDVAKAVANKLKSALPGWLVGNKSNSEKVASVMQAAEAVGCRFGLCDIRRVADLIVMSPNKKLSVVVDSLGRIVLIDNLKGVIVRMWKGYRGSQCAFLQVPDEERNRQKSGSKKRVALFLIIYTPKKGTIEIWAMQQGPRIVTFSASKYSKLIYVNYGLMGTGNVAPKNKYNIDINCILLDPDGQIKEILVPFHFALTEKNSKRARDVHLCKRLKQFIKSEEMSAHKLSTEVSLVCAELKTNEIRQQCLEMLVSSKHIQPEAVLAMADCYLEKLGALDGADTDVSRLIALSHKLKSLAHFYLFIDETSDVDAQNGNVANNNLDDGDDGSCEKEEVRRPDTRLLIAEKDMNNLQRLLDLSTINDERKSSELKVKFREESKSIFSEYLSVFSIAESKQITLRNDIADDKLYRVSDKIFKQFILQERTDAEEFKEHMARSAIRALDLIKMILNFWVNRTLNINVNLEKQMQSLSRILHTMCATAASDSVCADYNKISPFWTEIREYLANSAKPFPALTAAILCRSVAQRIEQQREAQQCSATSLEDAAEEVADLWEKLSQENCQWTLLIGKLEDVSVLNIILSNKPLCDEQPLPKLYSDPADISLRCILRRGRGAVSELVAQWLASGGISPELIVCNELCNTADVSDVDEASSGPATAASSAASLRKQLNVARQPVFDHINMLRKQFPYSLDSSAILANMCWEYALAWQKDIQRLGYLDAMSGCLRHVANAHIKRGLYNMVWTTHLKQTFEAACKLVNKVGKVPKEILCRQDTGLTDLQLPVFVAFCSDFLDQFLDVLQQCYGADKATHQFENLWENGGGSSLTELALQQAETNDSLLHIHYQLSLVVQVIATFGVKQLKPVVNLFDSFTINNFFADFSHSLQINTYSSEPKLLRTRTQFLVKVIDASIETVRVTGDGVYSQDHVNWMSKCVLLASVWGIDTDLLRRQQVLLLYANGLNDLADEILPSVDNTDVLGADLLAIAGKKLKLLLMSSEDLMQKVVALSPALTQYLDTLDKSWCAPGTLDSIINLAEHCVRSISETNMCYRQATSLLDACLTLREMNA